MMFFLGNKSIYVKDIDWVDDGRMAMKLARQSPPRATGGEESPGSTEQDAG